MPQLLSVNIATEVRTGDWTGDVGATGIDKRGVPQRVRIFDDHVDGDHVMDTTHHGGPYKAVYAYSHEDTMWWETKIGRGLPPGSFGENLTTAGLDINHARIGERWRIGTVVLQVTEPRIPCRVFAGFWERPHLVREFTEAGRSGTYLRIIEAGEVRAGDRIVVISRPDHDVTVATAFAARTGTGPARASLRAAYDDFPPKWQAWVDAGN